MNNSYTGPYELSFSKVNFGLPVRSYPILIYVGGMMAFVFLTAEQFKEKTFIFPVVAMLAFTLVLLGIGFFVQVRINAEGVLYKGLFTKKQLHWNEIIDAGVMHKGRYSFHRLEPHQFNRFSLGFKYMFVSRSHLYQPQKYDFVKPNDFIIGFDYRRDAYELIKYYLGKYQPVRPLQ